MRHPGLWLATALSAQIGTVVGTYQALSGTMPGMSLAIDAGGAGCGSSRAGEAPATSDGYWQCQNAPIETTAYFSEIFEMNAGMGAVQSAFARVLSTKYGYKGQVSCGMAYKGPTILAKLKDDHARFVKQLNQQGIKVVETGWAYAGGS